MKKTVKSTDGDELIITIDVEIEYFESMGCAPEISRYNCSFGRYEGNEFYEGVIDSKGIQRSEFVTGSAYEVKEAYIR